MPVIAVAGTVTGAAMAGPSVRYERLSASQRAASSLWWKGSRLLRSVPETMVGISYTDPAVVVARRTYKGATEGQRGVSKEMQEMSMPHSQDLVG